MRRQVCPPSVLQSTNASQSCAVSTEAGASHAPVDNTSSLFLTGPLGARSPGTRGRGASQVAPPSVDTAQRVIQS